MKPIHIRTPKQNQNKLEFDLRIKGEWLPVATHFRPHLDEIVSLFLLSLYGQNDKLTGTQKSPLLIGIGFDQLDEHLPIGQTKEETCAAILTAKFLNIDKMEKIQKLLKYTNCCDNGQDQNMGLGFIVNMMNKQWSSAMEQAQTIEWAFIALQAKLRAAGKDLRPADFSTEHCQSLISLYNEQELAKKWQQRLEKTLKDQDQNFQAALKELGDSALVENISDSNNRTLKIVSFQSDSNEIMAAAKFKKGLNADLVIKQNSIGQVSIMTKKGRGINLNNLIIALRMEEQKVKKVPDDEIENNHALLSSHGNGPLNIWFYHKKAKFILNGGLTRPAVEPTKLNLKKIVELVKISIDHKSFHPDLKIFCQRNLCHGNICPWFEYGLRQCWKVRKYGQEQKTVA